MLKKLTEIFESVPATLVGGVFLILSFVLPEFSIEIPIDPAWVTIIISGLPILYSAIKKLIKNKGINKISSSLLITIAMIASVGIGDLFAAGEIAFIMAIGEILEDKTTDRAKRGLKKLISLAPTQGRKIKDGKEEMIAARDICKNDILRILPGETIPVDGKIIAGETSIDQSVMTGEALPVDKFVGDSVFCGTLNCFGAIDIKATNVGEDSSLQKLIRMVKDAEAKKAPIARTADKFAGYFVPAACLIAIITGILTKDITRAVTVLVVFCPCALVLATPTAIMAAIGQATKHGVIIKSGEALEKMDKVDTVTFDKTGTLTYGKLEVSDIIPLYNNINENEILAIAASAEAKSEHPLGKAIVNHAIKTKIPLTECENFKMISGKGISAQINGKDVLCGNEKYLGDKGVTLIDETSFKAEELRSQGKACVFIALCNKIIGIIALSDTLRPEASDMISKLNKLNTKSVLLTGDSSLTARYFANNIGITEVHAELLPEEKVKKITELQSKNRTVCMIGDGVNDAPALKTADVGVAMGSMGSDIAIEAADIALMGDDIGKIPYLKKLSNATVKTIKLSVTLAMIINILAVILSVSGVLNPTSGALVHNAGSVFVVMIAALLYDKKFK